MTTKEVAQICGVTEKTVRENAKTFGKVFENGKQTDWNEEELRKVQLALMKNQISQGTETNGGVVENNLYTGVQVGLTFQEIVNSGNIEAMKELTTFAMNACKEVGNHNGTWKVTRLDRRRTQESSVGFDEKPCNTRCGDYRGYSGS